MTQKDINRINKRYLGAVTSTKLTKKEKSSERYSFKTILKKYGVATKSGDRMSFAKYNVLPTSTKKLVDKEFSRYNQETTIVKYRTKIRNKSNNTLSRILKRNVSNDEADRFWEVFHQLEDEMDERYEYGADHFEVVKGIIYDNNLDEKQIRELIKYMMNQHLNGGVNIKTYTDYVRGM